MASPQIELEPYEHLRRAEDQHTYEDITLDQEYTRTDMTDNKIVHEDISMLQWIKIFVFTLMVSFVSTCTVLIVFYFTLFTKLEVIMENNYAFLMTKQNISNTERTELGVKIEDIYAFLTKEQNSMSEMITAIHIGLRPTDCGEIYSKRGNGIYTLFPNSSKSIGFAVYCDFETDNGNWTVFQRRINGTTDFSSGWEEYKNGFGNLEAEFWLGNQKINELTSNGLHELRVEITDFDGKSGYAKYSTFDIGNVTTQYKLEVDGYSGDLGDCLLHHNRMGFSTNDRDNDGWQSGNCAKENKGGWWYGSCINSNLNGRYLKGGMIDSNGITWYFWKSSWYSMKSSIMMFRKVYPTG